MIVVSHTHPSSHSPHAKPEPEGILAHTESVCPVCLRRLQATYRVATDNDHPEVYLEKTCEEHGSFSTIVWRDSVESFLQWTGFSDSADCTCGNTACPTDCGLCEQHQSTTCSAALMVTNRCDTTCDFCLTDARGAMGCTDELYEPAIPELLARAEHALRAHGGPFPLELCGGEPTLRKDLPRIARSLSDLGFNFLQLNTNGAKLGQDPSYAHLLKDAGITAVYLGYSGEGACDTPSCDTHQEKLATLKRQAVKHCIDAELSVILVPVLNRHSMVSQLKQVIDLGKSGMPYVRGIQIQPQAFLGRRSQDPTDDQRITLPEILQALEQVSDGELKAADFSPSRTEHPLCSFTATYVTDKTGKLRPLPRISGHGGDGGGSVSHADLWSQPNKLFQTLTVGGMLFQDAWNFDACRAEKCDLHVISGQGDLIPLCCKYLSAADHSRVHPGIA